MYTVGIRVVGLIACVILFLFDAASQQVPAEAVGRVKVLPPLEVAGSWLHSYTIGSFSSKLDTTALRQHQSTSLGQLLQTQEGIYLKEYGPGMLSSISLRGTSPSQTTLLWNGLPVNYPSLGQADFSLIPAYFIDEAEVFYGGVSALAGSGAIGGAISLNDKIARNRKSFGLTTEVGSFGTTFSGLKASLSKAQAGLSIAAFHRNSENNYAYRNQARAGAPVEKQAHGAFSSRGVKASAFWSPWSKGAFDISGWYTHNEREIIPPYTVSQGRDTQEDESLRLSTGYSHTFSPSVKWESRAGLISDQIRFNGLASTTTQYMWNSNLEWLPAASWQVRAGALVNHIVAGVPEYGRELSENRSDLYLMLNWYASRRWEVSGKMRQALQDGFRAPLAPSLGATFGALQRGLSTLDLRAEASRSYRLPTLNDRHWTPGGNADLQAEHGWNAESGVDYATVAGNHSVKLSATGFGHWIDDWILWLPQSAGFWSPLNVRNVFSGGAELNAKHTWKLSAILLSQVLNYKYTRSQIRKGYGGDDGNIGNQLPYVPLHQASWVLAASFKKWAASSTVTAFGGRYTLVDNDVSLAPYAIWDLGLSRDFEWRKIQFAVSTNVRNLLNASYENIQFRPMPGRSFSIQLNLNFNQYNR